MGTGLEQPGKADGRVIAGNEALAQGAWREARDLFEQALRHQETPEALEGLGRACWWLDDAKAVGDARERAYRAYRERGDALGASRLALALAEDALIFRAEEAVWSGWTERARRLLEDLEPAPEHVLLAAREGVHRGANTGPARRSMGDSLGSHGRTRGGARVVGGHRTGAGEP